MLTIKNNEVRTIPATGSWPETEHVFEEKSIWAVNAALTAQRPLLVRGEPGIGKSQLARAAAHALGRVFISEVVNARSECQDLQWHFDSLARLGEAQALGAYCKETDVKRVLDPLRFLSPGALWWTFNWEMAEGQARNSINGVGKPEKPSSWSPENGGVLLIDEIDKADADLPNGLLETLGNGAFTVPYLDQPVKLGANVPPPLVVITTNEERELPSAFVRRCLVLHMNLPDKEDELVAWLMERGRIHFGDTCTKEVRKQTALMLWEDRQEAIRRNQPTPGQAEYLDILRALKGMGAGKECSEDDQLKQLEMIREFALKKYPDDNR
ncbi:MAG: MoxR family ATPase [Desulfobacteraceae bacterium]|nr:MoxR family ATPase [Desulfobacteraceae bacterium]